MGKTAFAISLARNVALVQKCSVGYFSIEMAKEQLMSRVLAQESSVALSSVIDGNVGVEAWSGIVNSSAKLSDSRLAIDDSSFLCPFELQKKWEKLKNKNGLDLVVIDYLQLMRTEKRLSSRRLEIAEICHWLKVMARDLDVPVIALSQLNRPTERRRTRRPALNDLRETPAIGDLADTVLTLYREHYYDTFVPNSVLEVNVLKSSTGMVGAAELGWDAKCVRVGNRFT